MLVSGNGSGPEIWDVTSGRKYVTLKKYKKDYDFVPVTFSPDGNLIATGGNDNIISLWDANYFNETKAHKSWQQVDKLDFDDLHQFAQNFWDGFKITELAVEQLYALVKDRNTISEYVFFLDNYEYHHRANAVLSDMYMLVREQNNIAGYLWFLNNYGNYAIARTALDDLHSLAFESTQMEGTIDSYNDFIIAYPYSKRVKEATEAAYRLEDKYYSSAYSSDEKNARVLLVRSKQLERTMQSLGRDSERDGYRLVINRMNDLLQEKFPAEDATLRYLESEEFKSFYKSFNSSMRRINRNLDIIASNTSSLDSILRDQTHMIDWHFGEAARSEALAAQYTEDHRLWERYIKDK